jgi:hypothetical protein
MKNNFANKRTVHKMIENQTISHIHIKYEQIHKQRTIFTEELAERDIV